MPARLSLAAACAVILGATATLAQSTGAASSPSGTSNHTDRYGTGSTSISTDPGSTTSTYSSDTSMTGRSGDKLSWGDRRFVTKAAEGGNDEIALAKLATERAANSDVRSFAQKLVDDHENVASELSSIASSKNVKIEKDDDHDRTYKRLSRKSGSEFDHEFVEHMIDEHEKDIKMFEKAAQDAKDPDVRSFAAKHVDHLRQHLQQAQSLRQSIMPTGRSDDNSGRGSSINNDATSDTSSTFGRSTTSSTTSSNSTKGGANSTSTAKPDASSSNDKTPEKP
ncbi:MAG: DUF4142 domain-containing protein [Opitutaceae bacterium]|nr:DUF4142 domain-containing protein [Opitutaceae bacterium]